MGLITAHVIRYVPDLVLERFASGSVEPDAPHVEAFRAAVLFADIAGFTALTERLARQGPAGAEQVASLLNGYFGRFLDTVVDAGGDVLKLAGDAALVVWRERAGGPALSTAVEHAVATALRLQELLGYEQRQSETPLVTRIAVGAGELSVMYVGGVRDRWELLVSGPTVDQIGVCGQAAPGQVVLSAEAARLLSRRVSTERLKGGAVRVDGASWIPATVSIATRPALPPESLDALRSYLPGAVRARIDAGQLEWLAELRTVAVLFIKLHDAKKAGADDLAAIDAQVRAIQAALYRYEGSLNKLSLDDKGVTAVAAMGLPPFAHEDDALRAVRAARRIREELGALGARCAVGVAHGRVFCGIVGSARRCEYTVIGDVVNLAARLMQAAGDGILCDASTHESASQRFEFDVLPSIAVKGKPDPVAVFAPTEPIVTVTVQRPIVGRGAELLRITERLRGAQGGALVIEGDAGIGKSRLVAEAVGRARDAGVQVLPGRTDPTERSARYYAWRDVFSALLGVEHGAPATIEAVKACLGTDAHHELLPLLNEVLPLGLPDNDRTSEMRGDVRADNTRRLLLDLLAAAADRRPIAVVLEDIHWIDSASLGLALACARRLATVPFVLTTRPVTTQSVDPDLAKLLHDPATVRLRLSPLQADEIRAILCRCLGAASLTEAVVDLVGSRAQGNPFFSEELGKGLRDAGVIVVRDGEARVASGVDLEAAALPGTIDAVITARVDRLSPEEQLTLKVASVIGRVFELTVLRAVHPTAHRELLPRLLLDLEERELISVESVEPEARYAFRHALIVDAVYGLMLFAQRRQLHRAVAEFVEHLASTARSDPPNGLLAHHWARAGDDARALVCLERAGEQALRSGAYTEAATFLNEGLGIVERAPSRDQRVRVGRMYRQLGEAQMGLGQSALGSQTLERALETLHASPPWSGGVPVRILSELLTQVAHRARPRAFAGTRADDAAIQEEARAWHHLCFAFLYTGQATKLVAATLTGLNRAEDAGASSELVLAYGITGFTARVAGLERVGRAYMRYASETATAIGEQMAEGFVRNMEGVAAIGRADWETAEQELDASMQLYDQFGNRRRWTEVVCQISTMAHFRGRFEERLGLGAQVWARGKDTRDVQSQAWGLLDQSESLVPLGRFDEARALLEAALGYVAEGLPNVDQLWAHGLLAVTCLRQGDTGRARAEAEHALRLTKIVPPTLVYIMEGYAGASETFLALWEAQRGGRGGKELRAKALAVLRHLRLFAWSLPVGLPRSFLCAGLAAWLDGRPRAAHRAWQRSLEAAARLGMPYEEARARCEIGRHLPPGDPERRRHLERARASFERTGAAYDLRRVVECESTAWAPSLPAGA